jgi:glycosyltransferase involved in cell wall biosynthesis
VTARGVIAPTRRHFHDLWVPQGGMTNFSENMIAKVSTTKTLMHLTASPFFGGPERQMLGLAGALAGDLCSILVSFSEGGRCRAFLEEAGRQGFAAHELAHDTPRIRGARAELVELLRRSGSDILFCHGYKASLIGRLAARRAKIPVAAVSRGWTYESAKVRLYELLDRINLRWMDRVVCVSQGQAAKVRGAGIPRRKIVVIPNAIDAMRFATLDPAARTELERLFPRPVRRIVGAAGRLSPEKGFLDLVDAAALVVRRDPEVGFVLFGEGALRPALGARIKDRQLSESFILAGFRPDLDHLLPALDLLVQSSYTEGMPNVILEACAAGVPVLATAVGGTPEILEQDLASRLVPPGKPDAMGQRILETFAAGPRSRDVGMQGQQHVRNRFTFEAQAALYRQLISTLSQSAIGGQDRDVVRRETTVTLPRAFARESSKPLP